MSWCGLPRSPQSCRGHDAPAHFSWNTTFAADKVRIDGAFETYERGSDDGFWARHHFCGTCGVSVHYEIERRPNLISIPAGAFADPDFPPPGVEVYEERRCPWLPPLAPAEA